MRTWELDTWQQLSNQADVDAFLRRARSPSTLATYGAQRKQFTQFCDILGVHDDDCFSPDTLCRWIMGRSANGYKLSTIELGLHAIGDWLPSRAVLRDAMVVAALRAAAKRPSSVSHSKLPILRSLLQLLVPSVPTYWRQARDFAFWLLAWYGMFRGSELVHMSWEDVTVQQQGVIILVRQSKTDQAGAGQHVFISHSSDPVLCPVTALHRLAEYTADLHGPLFAVHQHSFSPVSKQTMLSRLHRALDGLSQPHHLFGLHSFRSGGATAAAMGGISERLIKAHGRWVSDVVRQYTCSLPDELWQVSDVMNDV